MYVSLQGTPGAPGAQGSTGPQGKQGELGQPVRLSASESDTGDDIKILLVQSWFAPDTELCVLCFPSRL